MTHLLHEFSPDHWDCLLTDWRKIPDPSSRTGAYFIEGIVVEDKAGMFVSGRRMRTALIIEGINSFNIVTTYNGFVKLEGKACE